jgi:hypothetical protein
MLLATQSNYVFAMNDTAAAVWLVLVTGGSSDEAIGVPVNQPEVDRGMAACDATMLCQEPFRRNLLFRDETHQYTRRSASNVSVSHISQPSRSGLDRNTRCHHELLTVVRPLSTAGIRRPLDTSVPRGPLKRLAGYYQHQAETAVTVVYEPIGVATAALSLTVLPPVPTR